ncbi:hypothetical protein [Pseudomonas piscis]|nr:hypothetical protein [Pseudomonas piscis]MCU7646220.1 hypothetical protein [Pseudomonas piscis]
MEEKSLLKKYEEPALSIDAPGTSNKVAKHIQRGPDRLVRFTFFHTAAT